MSDRYNEMNEFLSYMGEIFKSNPGFEINKKNMYYSFVTIGTGEEKGKYDLSSLFPYWIERFKNHSNIEVFNAENWRYFCQFKNTKQTLQRTHIKIYIPLKKDGMYNGANQLFDFLNNENIKHISKIGSDIRNDSIVVRVYDKESAIKVANFVNSNSYIKEHLIKPNPFMLNDGNIGYATDSNLSYSEEMCYSIISYFKTMDRQMLPYANVEELLNHIKKQYNDVFIKKDKESVLNYESLRNFNTLSKEDKIYTMANSMKVMELIIASLSGQKLSKVIDIFNDIENQSLMRQNELSIAQGYNSYEEEAKTLNNNENILYEAIKTNLNKHGYENTKAALYQIVNNGFFTGITRDNNARNSIIGMSKEDIVSVMRKSCNEEFNVDLYLNYVLNRQALEMKETCLEDAIITTLDNYDTEWIDKALTLCKEGNYCGITRKNDARKNMINNVAPHEIDMLMHDILIKNGVDKDYNIQSNFILLMQEKLMQLKSEKQEEEKFTK